MLTWLLVIDPKSGEETLIYILAALLIGIAIGWAGHWFITKG